MTEELSVYSTNLKDNRYLVRCLTVAENTYVNEFVVDTGAKYTCCNCSFVDRAMNENMLSNCDVKLIGGLVRGEFVKFYKYKLKQFTIGNIDMKEQDIWVTFEQRVTDAVLGMDILKQIIIVTNPYNQMVYFCKDCNDYQDNFELKVS